MKCARFFRCCLGLLALSLIAASTAVFADQFEEDSPTVIVVPPGTESGPVPPGVGVGVGVGIGGGTGLDSMWSQRIVRLERIVNSLERRIGRLEERMAAVPVRPEPPAERAPSDTFPQSGIGSWRCLIRDQGGTPFASRGSSQQEAVDGAVALCLRFRGAAQCVPSVECRRERDRY